MRTIKQILESGEHLEEYSIVLKNGVEIEGLLVHERVDKSRDTEGYNIYDIRSGETKEGIELMYAALEPNVWVDWADSIATKQTLDFGEDGFLEIENDDVIEWERERIASGIFYTVELYYDDGTNIDLDYPEGLGYGDVFSSEEAVEEWIEEHGYNIDDCVLTERYGCDLGEYNVVE